jgi:hypothetical protein
MRRKGCAAGSDLAFSTYIPAFPPTQHYPFSLLLTITQEAVHIMESASD